MVIFRNKNMRYKRIDAERNKNKSSNRIVSYRNKNKPGRPETNP
jgi:hypothetical protein